MSIDRETSERTAWNASAKRHLSRCSQAGQQWIRRQIELNDMRLRSAEGST